MSGAVLAHSDLDLNFFFWNMFLNSFINLYALYMKLKWLDVTIDCDASAARSPCHGQRRYGSQ
jgi:hypothetical protein